MTWVAVGTAAAVGAGVGGVSAAAQGKSGDDVLKSALIGGVTGAVTGGAGAAASGLTSTAGTVGTELGKEAITEGITQGVTQGAVDSGAGAGISGYGEANELFQPGTLPTPPAGSVPTPPAGTVPPVGTPPSGILQAGPQAAAPTPSYTPAQLDDIARSQGVFPEGSNALPGSEVTGNASLPTTPEITPKPSDNGFMQGFSEFAEKHPFYTGAGIYAVAKGTGMLDQKPNDFNQPSQAYSGPVLSKDFKGGPYSEPNVYKPRYAAAGGIMMAGGGSPVEQRSNNMMGGQSNMFPQSQQEHTNFATPTQMPASAEIIRSDYDTKTDPYSGIQTTNMASGGIAHYYRGRLATSDGGRGDVYGATQRFLDMYDPQSKYTPPSDATNPDVGIFRDTSPSTRDKSPLEASQIRQSALEKRAYVNTGAKHVPPSRNMGQLSFATPGAKGDKEQDYDSVLAASGGIMQANLGGYAHGGNPRLLRGPGDGMSDDIPASIGGKQPARLADGEFVVPADVVSHLGNGSTEAGAKKLHQMMDKVRMDRTGRKKQAPAVKPGKYIPK